MKTFVVGDIHGTYKALLQCFDRSGFNRASDRLIVLGDICDRNPEVKQCIDELLKIKHCDFVLGNHDMWALDWGLKAHVPDIWLSQGGDRTIGSYDGGPMPKAHVDFLMSGNSWLEIDGRLFVHGGFNPDMPLSGQSVQDLVWDRALFSTAWKMHLTDPACKISHYEEIFVGHTPTIFYHSAKPVHACNVWGLDTGAGWTGKLTIMDVSTKQYWQSDAIPDLYAGLPGRM